MILQAAGSVIVALAVAWTAADCRVRLRAPRWHERRARIQAEREAWPFDAECDYHGLRALARATDRTG